MVTLALARVMIMVFAIVPIDSTVKPVSPFWFSRTAPSAFIPTGTVQGWPKKGLLEQYSNLIDATLDPPASVYVYVCDAIVPAADELIAIERLVTTAAVELFCQYLARTATTIISISVS